MEYIKLLYKKLICIVVCAVMAVGQVSALAADDAAAEEPETVVSDIPASEVIALRVKTPYYLKDGKQVSYCENKDYYPLYRENELMVPGSMIGAILDCSYSFNSKKEEAVMKLNGRTVSVRAGADGIYIDGKSKYLTNMAEYTGKEILLPFDTVAEALGYSVFKLNDDLTIAAPDGVQALCIPTKNEVIKSMINTDKLQFTDDFDGSGSGWGLYNWNNGTVTGELSADCGKGDDKAMYISHSQTGYGGYNSLAINYDHAKEYRLTFDAKATDDFANSELVPKMWMMTAEDVFIGSTGFYSTCKINVTNEWQTFTYILPKYYIYGSDYDNFAKFQVAFHVSSTLANQSAGGVYVDNVRLEENVLLNDSVDCDMLADKYAAWYTLGDTVYYTALNPDALNGFKSVRADVYDSDYKLIYTDTHSTEDFIKNGWKYKPDNYGYYEVDFVALAHDGTQRQLVRGYTKTKDRDSDGWCNYYHFARPCVQFAVVDGEAKPMAERNDALMASISPFNKNDTEMKLLDMLGISGLRLHYLRWGSGYGAPYGIEDEKGVYNFTQSDTWIEPAEKYGFKHIVANVLATPIWAVEEQFRSTEVSYSYLYEKMGPEKMSDLADFIKEFYNHYKGKVDIMEFWNEPHYGNTAFWADTPEKLSDMTKTAYKALREVDPNKNMLMSAHAWNQGYQLYDELLYDEEYYNSYDLMSFHSRYADDYQTYLDIDKKHGYESKPAFASEEYLYSAYQRGIPHDHNVASMHLMACYLNHYKHDLMFTTLFEAQDNYPDEVRVAYTSDGLSSSHTLGLFTTFPYSEPHKGAVAAFNLYKTIGLDFDYTGEFDFGDGQKAVYFLNDGEPLVIVWNSDDKAFMLSDKLKSAFGSNASVKDYMGRTVDADSELNAYTMYYVSGFDKAKLDALEQQPDTALNDMYEREYYTCKFPEFIPVEVAPLDENYEGILINNAKEKPFDKDTFEMNENVEWITDNWNWVTQNHDKPSGFDAKFSAYVDKDGMYLAVDVTDSTPCDTSGASELFASNMWEADSVQFAFDCYGTGDPSMRAEFQVGKSAGEHKLYKHNAPEIDFAMVEGWHDSNSELDAKKYLRIEKTSKGYLYKIFIPMGEMYPFTYSDTSDHIRLSVLVNDNNGTGRSYYEWSSGIGGNKDPKQFGALKFNH